MLVTDALVNTGQLGLVTGFGNARLPNRLGPYWKAEGGFGYSFQISFNLNDVNPSDIRLARKAISQTQYQDPTGLRQPPKDIFNDPLGMEDSPNEGNVKREAYRDHKGQICGGRITVWDAPGPRDLITKNPVCYPIEFRGRFQLQVVHQPTLTRLYTIVYVVAMRTTIFQGAITHSADAKRFPSMFDVLRRAHGG